MLDSQCLASTAPGSSLRPVRRQNECPKTLVSTVSRQSEAVLKNAEIAQLSPEALSLPQVSQQTCGDAAATPLLPSG
ncbi:hypothetical protein CSUI_000566, partial [Cystoisospora suis]